MDIENKTLEILDLVREKVLSPDEALPHILRLFSVVWRSEQSCKHPNSCAMGYYHQIGNYYCSKCQKTGL